MGMIKRWLAAVVRRGADGIFVIGWPHFPNDVRDMGFGRVHLIGDLAGDRPARDRRDGEFVRLPEHLKLGATGAFVPRGNAKTIRKYIFHDCAINSVAVLVKYGDEDHVLTAVVKDAPIVVMETSHMVVNNVELGVGIKVACRVTVLA